jgi:hypothetical protein
MPDHILIYYTINNMHMRQFLPFQMEPFNGDLFIQEEVLQLKKTFNIKAAIETGTFVGSTTLFLARNFEQVLTLEINESYYDVACQRLNDCENVLGCLADSSCHLQELLDMIDIRDTVFFFADAHWGLHCPLEDELKAFALKGIRPVIAIHDFKVPGEEELGYDSYNGQDFTFDWLQPRFEEIYGEEGYHYHYNSGERSAGAKRGIIYIYPA